MKKAHVSTSDIPSMRGKEDMPRQCEHDGCDADGMYPAPRTREDLRNYINASDVPPHGNAHHGILEQIQRRVILLVSLTTHLEYSGRITPDSP